MLPHNLGLDRHAILWKKEKTRLTSSYYQFTIELSSETIKIMLGIRKQTPPLLLLIKISHIWGWVKTYYYHICGNQHPLASYFRYRLGRRVLTHSHLWSITFNNHLQSIPACTKAKSHGSQEPARRFRAFLFAFLLVLEHCPENHFWWWPFNHEQRERG